jgi:hypothetical protein
VKAVASVARPRVPNVARRAVGPVVDQASILLESLNFEVADGASLRVNF